MAAATKPSEVCSLACQMDKIGRESRAAARILAKSSSDVKNAALHSSARALRDNTAKIITENQRDLAAGRAKGLSDAQLDRLRLDEARIEGIANSIDTITGLADPVGAELARWQRPNGLDIARIRVPLGVIGVIYESRPNVTADAGALCLKAGNACILRGGSESFHSSAAIHDCLVQGLMQEGLPTAAIQRVPTTDREAVGLLLGMSEFVDVIVPRGGRSLIERVQSEAKMPVFAHLDGVCHIYLHEAADPSMAISVTHNAKLRRVGICGAAETVLCDRKIAGELLPGVMAQLIDGGCEIRGDDAVQALDSRVQPAYPSDWTTEYLAPIISIKLVDGIAEAIDHINTHGSHHTDCIISASSQAAERFTTEVDSAIVMHNASTQFADGGEFGMGAEIGIATGRMHARGPVGVEQLTSFKYIVRGDGQTRPI